MHPELKTDMQKKRQQRYNTIDFSWCETSAVFLAVCCEFVCFVRVRVFARMCGCVSWCVLVCLCVLCVARKLEAVYHVTLPTAMWLVTRFLLGHKRP